MPEYDEFGRPRRTFIPPVVQPVQPQQLGEPPTAINPALVASSNLQNVQPLTSSGLPIPQVQSADYTPMQAGPATARLESIQPLNREDPQYKNSRLMTVINAIAGGLAGASGGPRVGAEVGSLLHDSKFNRAQANQDRVVNLLKTQSASEEKRSAEGIQRGGHQSLDTSRQVKAGQEEKKIDISQQKQDLATKEQASKQAHRLELGKYTEWKMANPKLDDLQYIMSLENPEEQSAAVAMIKKIQEGKQKSPEQIQEESKARATGAAEVAASPLGARAAANTTASRVTATDVAHANAPVSETDKAALDNFVSQARTSPDSWHNIYKEVPPKLKPKFAAVTADMTIPKGLDKVAENAVRNAQIALKHADSVEQLINNPKVKEHIGPIAGRISEADQLIGTSITGTPEEERLVQALMGMERYLITFEAASVAGSRPSWQLIRYLQGSSPQTKFNESRIRGSLDAVRMSAGNRIDASYSNYSKGRSVDTKKTKSGHVILEK